MQDELDRCPKFLTSSSTTDITFPEPAANEFIGWNAGGSNLANISSSAIAVLVSEELGLGTVPEELTDLSDVTITGPVAGHILRYDGAMWTNYADSNYQPSDATLTSIALLGTAADKMIYTTGEDTWAETAITAFARSILDDADEATFKATVNLEIGTDVQAWDAQLDDIAALAVTDSNFIVGDGSNWVAENGNTVRSSLDLGTGNSPTFAGLVLGNDASITVTGTLTIDTTDNIIDCAGEVIKAATFLATNTQLTSAGITNGVSSIKIGTAGTLTLISDDDEDDYLQLNTVAHVPVISTVGACDLKITASSGEIGFDDENLTTTGTLKSNTHTINTAGLDLGVDIKGTTAGKFLITCETNGGGNPDGAILFQQGLAASRFFYSNAVPFELRASDLAHIYGNTPGSSDVLNWSCAGATGNVVNRGTLNVATNLTLSANRISASGSVEIVPVGPLAKVKMGNVDGGSYIDIHRSTAIMTFYGSARINWTKYTAGAVDVTGFTEVGQNDAWLQSHDDSTVFTATEVAGGNNDVVVNFTSVHAFNWVQILLRYQGSAAHFVFAQLEVAPFDGTTWHTYGMVRDQSVDQFNENLSFFVVDDDAYINSGVVKVRLLHSTTTVNNHLLVIDEVALYQ
jgi:hypothetical protein